ncbi:unnamed protein product [Penicillium olsonii]|nr:unnamed protein product [Penicillium olsonii]
MFYNALLAILLVLPVAHAGGWDDFSNNLATDLAPFLSLFGEQITKQYLSECTTMVDYFIFAMAPMGILTGLVSAIRVCGTPSLRAFIGRAQEGAGNAEAELCTSTSRDVCELYNSGGIARVFGRPKILEVLHDPAYDFENAQDQTAGIYTFQEYIAREGDKVWERKTKTAEEKYMRRFGLKDVERKPTAILPPPPATFAPNLSLNIGIKKPHKACFFAIAATGFLLQVGVLVFAGVATYLLKWGNDDSPPESYACPLVISGTVLVCGGMFHCAFLIGQSTKEDIWIRKKRGKNQADRLSMYWVQPGGQIIGDQTFDAFSHTDHDNHLQKYMTSRKDVASRISKVQIWAAIGTTLVGFVLQFTGLRGIHSSVSVAQLGVIMVMSIARAALRMQRLKPEDNSLAEFPDEVLGHELDWLAMRMGREVIEEDLGKSLPASHQSFGSTLTSLSPPSNPPPYSSYQPSSYQHSRPRYFWKVFDRADGTNVRLQHSTPSDQHNAAAKILAYRTRLTSLTDSSALPSSLARDFKDDMVQVRGASLQLATMIDATLKMILSKAKIKEDWWSKMKKQPSAKCPSLFWGLECTLSREADPNIESPGTRGSNTHRTHTVYIELVPEDADNENGPWILKNKRELEGILGLWTWSLKAHPDIETVDFDTGLTMSVAGDIQSRRIVPASQADRDTGDLAMWLGEDMDIITKHSLHPASDGPLDPSIIWRRMVKSKLKQISPRHELRKSLPAVSYHKQWFRFFGWKASNSPENQDHPTPSVWSSPVQGSLVSACAQQVFISFLSGILDIVEDLGDVNIQETKSFRLENSLVTEIVELFTEMQLGSRQEALMCVLPLMIPRLRVSSTESGLDAAITTATDYRRRGEWGKAEGLLRWAWRICAPPDPTRIAANSGNERGNNLPEKAATALCELYRWALVEESKRAVGERGIEWLYQQQSTQLASIRAIVDRYVFVAKKMTSNQQNDPDHDSVNDPLAKALLFVTNPESVLDQTEKGEALCFAVRSGWDEVVLALLELRTDPNFKDERNSRTPLSYAAEKGNTIVVRECMRHGSFPDMVDSEHRTPLSYAAEAGFDMITKLLLNDVRVSPNQSDKEGHSPLWWAARDGHRNVVEQLLDTNGTDITASEDTFRRTLLHLAASGGYESTVELLLDRGAALDPTNRARATPLHEAAAGGHVSTVKLLLDRGAAVNSANGHGGTPLHQAAAGGSESTVKLILDKGGSLDTPDMVGYTPLHEAASGGHASTVGLLLTRGAVLKPIDNFTVTPLHLAASNGHDSAVKMLLDKGADLESTSGASGDTPLHEAAFQGHESTVKLLIDRGATLDPTNKSGHTPLFRAASGGHTSTMNLLLHAGAAPDPNIVTFSGRTLLHEAASGGHLSAVRLLLDSKVWLNPSDASGDTPLHYAACGGHDSIVELLLDHGAALEPTSSLSGYTPLHEAASNGHLSTVKLLLDRGVSLDRTDDSGDTALHEASSVGRDDIVKLLLDRGAAIGLTDASGDTPLHKAAFRRHRSTVQLLIDSGADVNQINAVGDTPLHMAGSAGDPTIIQLLQDEGATLNPGGASGDTLLRAVAHGHGRGECICCDPIS